MRAAERGHILLKWADILKKHADEIAELESLDNGKPIRDARNVDLPGSYEILRYMAGWATKINGETITVSAPGNSSRNTAARDRATNRSSPFSGGTAALMAIFYDRLWKQGKPPIEALREAQLALYHQPELVGKLARARGTPDFDKLVRGTPDFDKFVQRHLSMLSNERQCGKEKQADRTIKANHELLQLAVVADR